MLCCIFSQNLNKLAELVRGVLPKLVRSIIGALITIDVHARDIVTQMVVNKVCVLPHTVSKTGFSTHAHTCYVNLFTRALSINQAGRSCSMLPTT